MAAQETRGLYREQGACCEQRPAALKRRSPVQTPARRPTPARLCQATPQPAGSDLQLQHLSRISSSATTLRSQQVRVVEGGVLVVVLVLAGAHGRGLARDLKRRLGGVVLLIYCRAACFLFPFKPEIPVKKNKNKTKTRATRRPSSE